MFIFSISIEQGGTEYRDGSEVWIDKFFEDMMRYINLTDGELKTFAEGIRLLVLRNYLEGRTNTGEEVAPLAFFTIQKKGHARPFLETGLLFDESILKQKIPNGWEIFVAEQRAQIAFNLQYGIHTGGLPMPARPAFGVSPERAETLLSELVNNFHYNKT